MRVAIAILGIILISTMLERTPGLRWCDPGWSGAVWGGLVWFDVVWFGMEWLVWSDLVWAIELNKKRIRTFADTKKSTLCLSDLPLGLVLGSMAY
jgi:hypothetical protein